MQISLLLPRTSTLLTKPPLINFGRRLLSTVVPSARFGPEAVFNLGNRVKPALPSISSIAVVPEDQPDGSSF
jgi:hypothetical protein